MSGDHASEPSGPRAPMTVERFFNGFAKEFDLAEVELAPTTHLFDDLEFDSFDVFRLLLWLEVIAEVPYAPDGDLPETFRLGDVYDFYRTLVLAED